MKSLNEMYRELCAIAGEDNVFCDEEMKHHTTFKIGGPADFFVTPDSEERIGLILKMAKKKALPIFIMGNGSNLLVRDAGIRGVVLCIGDKLSNFSIEGERIYAQAGILMSTLSSHILEASLQGFEFASGIPGTLGGGLSMNAGAYGGELKDVVESVRVMDRSGKIWILQNEEMGFDYRRSCTVDKGYLILSAVLKLQYGNHEQIKATIDDFTKRRMSKQPLSANSAGSTFKRPEGFFAGKLIEEAGLKGVQMKNAAVSDLHSGFVINTGGASCENVLQLIDFIKARVYSVFGVRLEEEVKIVGEK